MLIFMMPAISDYNKWHRNAAVDPQQYNSRRDHCRDRRSRSVYLPCT